VSEARKIAAILVADIVGFSRLAGVDEERTLARLRALRSDLIDPTIALHNGRLVKRTGDGAVVEFRSVVEAVRSAIEVQTGIAERNAGLPADKRIEVRVGIHLGDIVEEADGDLMGDGVNIASRLEGMAKPGGICLSQAAYEQVRDRVEEEFDDLGEQSLKNIARPMRIYALKSVARPTAPPAGSERAGPPPRFSIVVLPFANIGGDPEQECFVDGVTESLTTDLSRMQNTFVVGRSTAFTYKGKPIDAKSLGRELNVRYVLEGSVQRRGDRIRVNVQLVDADSGNHLWAERFDKPVADFFDMQDEIVARLANELGSVWFSRGITPENLAQARGFCERALALDQNNEMALVMTAFVDFYVATNFFSEDRTARLAAAEAAAIKALSLAPQYALAHHCLGVILGFTDGAEEGIAECQRALAIDRNLAGAHATIGFLKVLVGRAEETEAHVQEALRLSPRDTYAFEWLKFVGIAKCVLGRYDEGVVWLRRSIETNRNNPTSRLFLAAALAALGRLEEARAVARAALTLNPQYTIAGARDILLSAKSYLVEVERMLEGLRKAGVPEGDQKTNLYERAEAVSKH
jgi:TolB-like protein/Tfp pilus assembly protein PilF